MNIDEILDQREETHGDYTVGAEIADDLISRMEVTDIWLSLKPTQRTSLRMIALKISRILGGNPDEAGHWEDCAGYSQLIVRELENRGT